MLKNFVAFLNRYCSMWVNVLLVGVNNQKMGKGIKMAKKVIFVMLLIWATPLCVKGTETAETNASNPKHEQQTILKSKVEAESINNAPNVENDQESFIKKIQQLQYTQLLEVHRSYFTVFLQVLSIYLAVMGAGITIVNDSIRRIKTNEKDGSKTVIIALILFSFITSGLFFAGLSYGRKDANKRKDQIFNIEKNLRTDAKEKNLQIVDVEDKHKIKHISVELFQRVILATRIVTIIIMIGWIFVFVRGLMICAGKSTLRDFMADVKERILQRFKVYSK